MVNRARIIGRKYKETLSELGSIVAKELFNQKNIKIINYKNGGIIRCYYDKCAKKPTEYCVEIISEEKNLIRKYKFHEPCFDEFVLEHL